FDANRQLIAVYAGDLLGNMWKFDLGSPDKTNWKVAYSTTPIFTTRGPAIGSSDKAQPIFAKPLLRVHPDGGDMVLFGTGKLFAPGDRENQDVQSFYGIWDNLTSVVTSNFRVTNGPLVQQAITSKSTPTQPDDPPSTYFMTQFGVQYSAGKRGWFFDLGVTYG